MSKAQYQAPVSAAEQMAKATPEQAKGGERAPLTTALKLKSRFKMRELATRRTGGAN